MDTQKMRLFYDKLTFVYLQMPNFNKSEEELETHFDKWLYVFKNLHKLHDRPKRLQERVFEKLFSIAEIAKFTADEADAYEESLMVYRDLKNSIDTAREEGKLEDAKKMIEKGMANADIRDITGLSLEEIEKLRKAAAYG
jgi:predicted transposase/invertase (TIGR01784 family)